MPLHTKYRPKTLDQFIGHSALKKFLRSILDRDNRPRAYLFHGPAGCGKTTLARIVAKELANGQKWAEYDAAVFVSIDQVRELQKEVASGGGFFHQVRILDEFHCFSKNAMNGMLKILEEPKNSYFLMCTTEPGKLPNTIWTRCATFKVHRLGDPVITELVMSVVEAEGLSIPAPVLKVIVEHSAGIPRQALQNLAKVIEIKDPREAIELV